MTRRYLIDTNHMSAAVRPMSPFHQRLRTAHRSGSVFGTCLPVLGELETGFQKTADPERNRRMLRSIRKQVRLWPLDEPIARLFGEIFNDLRQRGRALSQIDILIAALCRHMNLILLTSDRDFEALPDLHTENWLIAPPAASP